jgi:hypothetical protein
VLLESWDWRQPSPPRQGLFDAGAAVAQPTKKLTAQFLMQKSPPKSGYWQRTHRNRLDLTKEPFE